MQNPRSMNSPGLQQLLKQLTDVLKSAVDRLDQQPGGGQLSESDPVIISLRGVFAPLLETSADALISGKGRDVAKILGVTEYILDRLPSVLNGDIESAVVVSLLRLLLAVAQCQRHLVDQLLTLTLRVLTRESCWEHVVNLYIGACELLLDCEHQLVKLSLAATDTADDSVQAATVSAFEGIVAWHAAVTAAGAAADESPARSLMVSLPSQQACMSVAHMAIKLLATLMASHPLKLQACTHPSLAQAIMQCTACGDVAMQADCMFAMACLVRCVGPPCINADDVLEMGLWLLEVWQQRLVQLPAASASTWQAALVQMLQQALEALEHQGVLPLHAPRAVDILVDVARDSLKSEGFCVGLCSTVHNILIHYPPAAQYAVGLLHLMPYVAASVAQQPSPQIMLWDALWPCLKLVNAWMQDPAVDRCLARISCQDPRLRPTMLDLWHAVTAAQHIPTAAELTGSGAGTSAQKTSDEAGVDDEVVIVGERVHSGGDAEVGPARKRRKMKLKQSVLSFTQEGTFTQAIHRSDSRPAAKSTQPCPPPSTADAVPALKHAALLQELSLAPAQYPSEAAAVHAIVVYISSLSAPSSAAEKQPPASMMRALSMLMCELGPRCKPTCLLLLLNVALNWMTASKAAAADQDHLVAIIELATSCMWALMAQAYSGSTHIMCTAEYGMAGSSGSVQLPISFVKQVVSAADAAIAGAASQLLQVQRPMDLAAAALTTAGVASVHMAWHVTGCNGDLSVACPAGTQVTASIRATNLQKQPSRSRDRSELLAALFVSDHLLDLADAVDGASAGSSTLLQACWTSVSQVVIDDQGSTAMRLAAAHVLRMLLCPASGPANSAVVGCHALGFAASQIPGLVVSGSLARWCGSVQAACGLHPEWAGAVPGLSAHPVPPGPSRAVEWTSLAQVGPCISSLLSCNTATCKSSVAVHVAAVEMLRMMLAFAPDSALKGAQQLLRELVQQVGKLGSSACHALVSLMPCVVRDVVLFEAWGMPTTSPVMRTEQQLRQDIKMAEQRLVVELKSVLHSANRPETGALSRQQAVALQCMAVLVGLLRSEVLVNVPLIIVIDNFSSRNLQLIATAGTLLVSMCKQVGKSAEGLILHSAGTRSVLEYVGRHLAEKPNLLPELARRLNLSESELAHAVLPTVIGWLFWHKKNAAVQALASAIGTSPHMMFINYADTAVAFALWASVNEADNFESFLEYVDEMTIEGDDFYSVVKDSAKYVIQKVLNMAGQPLHWDGYEPSEEVQMKTHQFLAQIANITGVGKDKPAELLRGHAVASLLKDLGQDFKDGLGSVAPGNALQRQQSGKDHGCGGGSGGTSAFDVVSSQLQSLRTLIMTVISLDSYVVECVPHVMALLTAAPRIAFHIDVKLQALTCWRLFVEALARHAPQLLARVLVQAGVVLLPSLEEGGKAQEIAMRVMELMVVENKVHTRTALAQLPPLPTSAPFAKLNGVLVQEKGIALLQRLVSSLQHESLAVRHSALARLRHLLLDRDDRTRGTLIRAVLRETTIEDVTASSAPSGKATSSSSQVVHKSKAAVQLEHCDLLGQLVSVLLRCCENAMRTHLGMSVRRRCAECLGLLGAVDPSRVSVTMPPPAPLIEAGSDGIQFAQELITRHLVRILTTADISTLEFTSYALQAILQRYTPLPEGIVSADGAESSIPDEAIGGLYARLPADIRVMVRPFLFSKYTVKATDEALPTRGSKPGTAADASAASTGQGTASNATVYAVQFTGRKQQSFRRWLEQWLRAMIKYTSGPLQPLFQALASVLKADQPLMMFVLPHVVHTVLTVGGKAAVAAVDMEVRALLTAACQQVQQAGPSASPAAGPQQVQVANELQLYLHTLFTLLDVLQRWVSNVQAEAQGKSGRGGGGYEPSTLPAGATRVKKFLDQIPKQQLAQAAFACGAHARALQYYETWVREEHGGGLNPSAKDTKIQYTGSQVSFLLDVYGQLEEPDGIAGLVQLRQGGLDPMDQVITAEKAGDWSEAMSLYEQMLSGNGGSSWGVHTVKAGAGALGKSASAATPMAVDLSVAGQHVGSGGLSQLQQGVLRGLLQMGHLQGLLQQVDGLLARLPAGRASAPARMQLAAAGIAAAWRMGRWGLLQEYIGMVSDEADDVPMSPADDWELQVGSLLMAFHQGTTWEVEQGLMHAREEIMAILPAISQESYSRAYPELMKLAMLQEIQDVLFLKRDPKPAGFAPSGNEKRKANWQLRLAASQGTLAAQEPLLALRRQLAVLLGQHAEAGTYWLQYARLCRTMSHHESAATATLEALASNVPGAVLERAKQLWHSGRERRALDELRMLCLEIQKKEDTKARTAPGAPGRSGDAGNGEADTMLYARAALQYAKWTAAQGQMGYHELRLLFEDAIKIKPDWEKGYFQYARYLDQLYQDAKARQTASVTKGTGPDRLGGRSKVTLGEERHYGEYLPEILKNYGRCMQHGYRHRLQCLPRMLTLFCDWGNEHLAKKRQIQQRDRQTSSGVVNTMMEFARKIPPVAWLGTLPQLISRIGHQHGEVSTVLQSLLQRCLEHFPQQALWAQACLMRSANKMRRSIAVSVLDLAKSKGDDVRLLVQKFMDLTDALIRLSNSKVDKSSTRARTLSTFPEMEEYIRSGIFNTSGVMVPTEDQFTVPMPAVPTPVTGTVGKAAWYNDLVIIRGIEESVQIMHSLMRPKKFVFKGSDGKTYPFLAKPKDDLRKDYRLMDLAGVANSMFSADNSARRRGLLLRTYAVLVITEECGILQWLNNLTPFKAVVEESYGKEERTKPREILNYALGEWEAFKKNTAINPNATRGELLDKVLARAKPMAHAWWLMHFPEPAMWLQVRLAFTRTNAVWCMVGHMLGLGDRHGENLMVDTASGETVHVDFGCLFDRGLMLEVPELVPFRLTQNVVDSFGVSGVEGVFRKCSEITLKVLRQHRSTLMTCAETFLYDPLVDWASSKGGQGQQRHTLPTSEKSDGVEPENSMAKDALATMEGRLTGTLLGVKSQPSLPLSVEGQVQRLISEATDKNNLGSMYIYWMPWY